MILAILQARLSSTRMPGKVLSPLLGEPMIVRQIERILRSTLVDDLVVATSAEPSDDPLVEALTARGITVRRGPLHDVFARFAGVVEEFSPDHIVRLTGDNPLVDPAVIDTIVGRHLSGASDYTSNSLERTFPYGLDVEVVSGPAFTRLGTLDLTAYDREHVTAGLYRRPESFVVQQVTQAVNLSTLRWTVDYPEDFEFVTRVYDRLLPLDPAFTMSDIVSFLALNPELNRTIDSVPS